MQASSPARPAGTSEPEAPGPGVRHGEPSGFPAIPARTFSRIYPRMQKSEDREPPFRDGAEARIARGPFEPAAEDRIAKQPLEARRDIGAMMFETVETSRRFVLSPSVHDHIPALIPMPFIVHLIVGTGYSLRGFLGHRVAGSSWRPIAKWCPATGYRPCRAWIGVPLS